MHRTKNVETVKANGPTTSECVLGDHLLYMLYLYLLLFCFTISLYRYLCLGTISIIRPVVGVSALKWFVRYIYERNLQFINKLLLLKLGLSSLRYMGPSLLVLAIQCRPFDFLALKAFNLFGFSSV